MTTIFGGYHSANLQPMRARSWNNSTSTGGANEIGHFPFMYGNAHLSHCTFRNVYFAWQSNKRSSCQIAHHLNTDRR